MRVEYPATPGGYSSDRTEMGVARVDDPRLGMALEEYDNLIQAGRRPDRGDFLARHRAIAEELVACLDGLEFLQVAAGEFTPQIGEEFEVDVPPPASILGDYRLVREVGRGGMGVVYEATQISLGRRVALKILSSAGALDPLQRRRFQVEAQAAASLHHENIVPVFGIGCDHGVHFYAMQYIEGRPLTDMIRETRAPEASEADEFWRPSRGRCVEAARLGLQAAEALEHAHAIGVIHRDIKPSNLLVDTRGKLWVADFGLAHLPQEDRNLTRTGELVGTLRYMSPEQARGVPGRLDARTDVYSLGVTLYELLTLRPAFDARDRQDLLRCILHEEPIAPRRRNSAIPRDLETIILKALEKEPWARYGSAGELAEDLRLFLVDRPVQARRPGPLGRAIKWARRHRTAVIATTVAIIVTLASTTVVLWEAKRRTEITLAAYGKARLDGRLAIEYSLGTLDQITRPLVLGPAARTSTEPSARRILEQARGFYEQIRDRLANDDSMSEITAKALRQSGLCRAGLGDRAFRDDYRSAIALYENIADRKPGFFWLRTGLIETLQEYSRILKTPADREEADAMHRRAVTVAEGLVGNPQVASPCFSAALIEPFEGMVRYLSGKSPTAPEDTARAFRLARQAVDWAPDRPGPWKALAFASCRAGDRDAASYAILKSLELKPETEPLDCLILADIARHRGETALARQWLARADAGLGKKPAPPGCTDVDLRRWREEFARGMERE